MSGDEAVRRVMSERKKLNIDPTYEPMNAERCIVEYKKDRAQPGPTTDRIAWIVSLGSTFGKTDVHVDDGTGEILAVVR